MAELDYHICRPPLSNNRSLDFCAEAGRYALYLQYGCPFAQRANIVLRLKGLDKMISVVVLDPTKTPEGFRFTGLLGTMKKDPFYNFSHIRQLYWKVDPERIGPFTIPLMWDRKKELIVSNESGDIMRILYFCFDHLLPEYRREVNRPGGGFYPMGLRSQIDAMNTWIQSDINACVYDVGAAVDQESYDARTKVLFSAFDRVERHFAETGNGPFIFGETITETDVRLFTSIIRFDVAYSSALRCSSKLVRYNYPLLHKWMQLLYWDDSPTTDGAFRNTTFFEHSLRGLSTSRVSRLEYFESPKNAPNIRKTDAAWSHPIYSEKQMSDIRVAHRKADNRSDRAALATMRLLRWGMDTATGYKHDRKGLTVGNSGRPLTLMTESKWLTRVIFLESIAGVPGMVAASLRHLQSLRRMKRDNGWIETLLEEAYNERMHLLTFLKMAEPGRFMRLMILGAQGVFYNAFFMMYLISPRTCHRFVGYLEEEAVITYTRCIDDLDAGKLPKWETLEAPEIAIRYWNMPEGHRKMKDLLLYIRADEAKHREVNHTLGNLEQNGDPNPFVSTYIDPTKLHPTKSMVNLKSTGWDRKDVV
ncbi:hypothetical protein VE02_05642 [Pseudogymnoascus sp. 03VT05]|nr:hypothetical protein VE02_05642 [Pseudogymnoascus sp. 03VT05]